jgi:hypothetical protein
LSNWKFELWITQSATGDYIRLKTMAEAAVSEGPLPLIKDARLKPRLAAVGHFERTRKLLKSIENPDDAGLDKGLFGPAHFVRYRMDLGTCIYFTRIITNPPAVLIYGIFESPLDPDGLRNIILSGDIGLLGKYGLPTLELPSYGMIQ